MQRFQECHSLATHDSGWRKAMMLGGSLLPPETSKRERFLSFPRSTSSIPSPSEITTIEYHPYHHLINCHHHHDLSQMVLSDLPLVAGPIYTRTRPVCLECLRWACVIAISGQSQSWFLNEISPIRRHHDQIRLINVIIVSPWTDTSRRQPAKIALGAGCPSVGTNVRAVLGTGCWPSSS